MESPFEVLGIPPDADDGEIVDAYRERVKEAHPDQGGSTEEFQAVKDAYERLQNGYEPGDPLPDESPTAEPGSETEQAPPEPDDPLVEFLNFEVLEDHGWALEDEDLFEKAADANLRSSDFGRFYVDPNDTLLEAAEKNGFAWPFACRGGACTNCAVAVVEGEMPSPASHILPPDLTEKGIRLSCIAAPVSDDAKIVYNLKHLPEVSELLLPASRFEQASSTD
ncbi:2Fe-2S iron-sulfur cluster binding domain-containing protein [Haloarcula hispanica]|uniref:2Fe-2S iron-sulfur cluster binding domain-containing protein n=1 Tax=Haloarcula hispanica TaxID=51589 RepID=A0A482T2X5_HALHI|nr:ferredoxin Fer [Haloarcula hispanica]KAA9408378.1 ferredoxin [Haloarcula hispanica]MCJ0620360.1 2Fe-2S iron-sulfur cluster binding domain-containing protein [Haloarcula hispanica]RYJ10768.1 2Fe-2S iron-sulfur cluster binding domain-containing protein [Haloarcula hispanica]